MVTTASTAVASGIPTLYTLVAGAVVFMLLVTSLLRLHRTGKQRNGERANGEVRALSGVLLSSRPQFDVRGAAGSTVWSLAVHALLIGGLVWVTMRIDTVIAADAPEVIPLTVEAASPLPPLPPTVSPPGPVVQGPIDVLPGPPILTIPTIVPDSIPSPRIGVPLRAEDFERPGPVGGHPGGTPDGRPLSDLEAGVIFTVFTVKPELKNMQAVQRVLERTYPPLLRDSGIGGEVLLWFLIDETGRVVKTQLKESSGHAALDEAAARVAAVMEFIPAKNRDKYVPVWVAIPIVFTTRQP